MTEEIMTEEDEPRYTKVSSEEQSDSETGEVIYAGFKRRVIAASVDLIVITFLALIIWGDKIVVDKEVSLIFEGMQKTVDDFQKSLISEGEAIEQKKIHVTALITNLIKNSIVQIFMAFAFILPLWYYKGATPGKMLYSMKIVDAKTLEKPKLIQLIVRFISYILSFVVIFMGFLFIGFDKRKQGWHDKISGTVVIHTKNLDSKVEKDKKFKRDTYMVIIFVIGFIIFRIFFSSK